VADDGRQRAILDIMKSATDPEGRKRAIEELGAGGGSDAMKAVAQAQLMRQRIRTKRSRSSRAST